MIGLYDRVLAVTMREAAFKRRLVEQTRIGTGDRVLDLDCGPATLTLLVKRTDPDADVVGIDGDSNVLRLARKKTVGAGLAVALDKGMSLALPYPDASFDRVLSS